nr:Chain A, Pilosulin-1 [Myrmecia pilosula]
GLGSVFGRLARILGRVIPKV